MVRHVCFILGFIKSGPLQFRATYLDLTDLLYFEMDDIQVSNFQLFRDCLATPLIEKSAERPKKSSRKSRGNGRRKTASMFIFLRVALRHS